MSDSCEEVVTLSEAEEDSFLDVGESVFNLFSFDNSPSTSALALQADSTEESCSHFEGLVVAVHEADDDSAITWQKNVE